LLSFFHWHVFPPSPHPLAPLALQIIIKKLKGLLSVLASSVNLDKEEAKDNKHMDLMEEEEEEVTSNDKEHMRLDEENRLDNKHMVFMPTNKSV
jgi:hypothetical protein